MEVKSWLESVSGLPVADTAFANPPPLPYLVFLDDITERGSDSYICIMEHSLAIELYSEEIRDDLEQKIEQELTAKGIEFDRGRVWIGSEGFYETIYRFEITEKRRNNI